MTIDILGRYSIELQALDNVNLLAEMGFFLIIILK